MNASSSLRRALLLDAAASGATGTLMLAAGPLASLTQLPPGLLRAAGAVLIPYAAFVLWLARRPFPARPLVLAVIALNVLWAAESAAILALGWVAPNALGQAFVLAQALVVAGFAGWQATALRGTRALAA